jgi:peptidoglycan/LPS O-acetylase OafA/YrhL
MKPDQIPSLTGLRFIAAATIVITHFTGGLGYFISGVPTNLSALGMPLFFTLSGFVIHYVYARPFDGKWLDASREFLIARIARLFPLFIFLFIFYAMFVGTFGKSMTGNPTIGISYVTMTASWWYWVADKSLTQLPYGYSWSVSTEVFFYVLYAIVLYRISLITRPRLCAAILVTFAVLAFAALYTIYVWQDVWEAFVLSRHPGFLSERENQADSFYFWLVYVSPYLHLFEFIGGCLTCQMFFLLRKNSISISRVANEVLGWAGVLWIVFFMICLYVEWHAEADFPSAFSFLRFVNFLHCNFLLAPGCYMLILALALGNCWLAKPLSAPLAIFLGEISYSIYLAHPLVSSLANMQKDFSHPFFGLTMMLLMTVALAAGLYRVVELPGKMWIKSVASLFSCGSRSIAFRSRIKPIVSVDSLVRPGPIV